jgi:hypothetical protein
MPDIPLLATLDLEDGELCATTEYSDNLVRFFKTLAGRWDGESRRWKFSPRREPRLRPYFGHPETGIVCADITRAQLTYRGPTYEIGAFVIASRRHFTDAAVLFADVLQGKIPRRGGSLQYPKIMASQDVVFRLEVPRDFAELHRLKISEVVPTPKSELISRLTECTNEELLAEVRRRGLMMPGASQQVRRAILRPQARPEPAPPPQPRKEPEDEPWPDADVF